MWYAVLTLPSATTTFAGISDYASSTFTEFLLVALALAGFGLGGMFLARFVGAVYGSIRKAIGARKGRRGRGRRR